MNNFKQQFEFQHTGTELKTWYGSYFEIMYDTFTKLEGSGYGSVTIPTFRVVECLGIELKTRSPDPVGLVDSHPIYNDTLDEALSVAYAATVDHASNAVRFYRNKMRSYFFRWTLFRYNMTKNKWFYWLGLSVLRYKAVESFLNNYRVAEVHYNLVKESYADPRRVVRVEELNDNIVTTDAPIIPVGTTIYRVQWAWPALDGVTLDELNIRDVVAYNYGDNVGRTIQYTVPMYGNQDEHSSTYLRFLPDGRILGPTKTAEYFFDRTEAEEFRTAKRQEICALVMNEIPPEESADE